MKKILAASMLLTLALSGVAVAYADDGSSGGHDGEREGGFLNAIFHLGPPGLFNDRPQGPQDNEGTSSNNGRHEGEDGGNGRFSGRMLPPVMNVNHGIMGVVSALGTGSFTLDTQKGGATTTLTVNVTDATKYQNGTTTASFASLSTGMHVTVVGPVSTSTMTVAANLVVINPPRTEHSRLGRDDDRPKMHNEDASTTGEQGDDNGRGDDHGQGKGPGNSHGLPAFLTAFKNFLLSGNASTTANASTSVSTSDQKDLIGFFRHFFGF